jgi:seryl-tRNA(Sec) selenium transferase
MLSAPVDVLTSRAERIAHGTRCRIVESRCALGGGTTPTETVASIAIEVPGNASELQSRFLRNDPPIVGRIHDDAFTIDVRTLLDADDDDVAAALATL